MIHHSQLLEIANADFQRMQHIQPIGLVMQRGYEHELHILTGLPIRLAVSTSDSANEQF
jgi:hypothetical protein